MPSYENRLANSIRNEGDWPISPKPQAEHYIEATAADQNYGIAFFQSMTQLTVLNFEKEFGPLFSEHLDLSRFGGK